MTTLIRFDDSEDTPETEPDVHGFGVTPPLAPPRPNAALTALVTGMALAVCIALTVTVMSLSRAQSGPVGAADSIVAAQPYIGLTKI